MGRLSHLGSNRNSDVLLVVQDAAWKTSPASGVMLSVRYQAHCSASQWYGVETILTRRTRKPLRDSSKNKLAS